MRLDILDYSVYGNAIDLESDRRIEAAARALGHEARIVPITREERPPDVAPTVWLRYDVRSPEDLAWIVATAQEFESSGRRVFPSGKSILVTEDKWESHRLFVKHRLPAIETFRPADIRRCGPGAVLKPRVGWGGMGMRVVDDTSRFDPTTADEAIYICQPFIAHERTFTMAVTDRELIAILEKRATSHDFRTDGDFGQDPVLTTQPAHAAEIAIEAVQAAGLAAGTVDLIEAEGVIRILEINSAPCLVYDNLPDLDIAGPMVKRVLGGDAR